MMFCLTLSLATVFIVYRLAFDRVPVLYSYAREGVSEFSNWSVTTSFTDKPEFVPSAYQPYQNILYNRAGGNTDRSVFVAPRRAYFDNRIHKGKPRNILVILAEVHDDAVKAVLACELNGFFSKSITVIKEDTGWVRSHKPGYTHCAILVECNGLNPKSLINGSFPRLVYKKNEEEKYSFVVSEMPLILKSFKATPVRGKGSVVTCTTMFGHPSKFNHWLKYQKTLGVDGVHINADQSFMDNAMVEYPFLNKSHNSGFTKMEVWMDVVGKRMFNSGQIVKYQDCVYRHINIYDYVFLLDYDDYFNPVVSTHKNIHYYVDEFFKKDSTGTILMPWRQMACRPTEEKCKTLQDGNLTSVLSGNGFSKRSVTKCAHRVSAVLYTSVHSHKNLLSGYSSIRTSDKLAYVAHNRHSNKLCN